MIEPLTSGKYLRYRVHILTWAHTQSLDCVMKPCHNGGGTLWPAAILTTGERRSKNQEETLILSTVAVFLCSSCRCRRNRSYCDEGVVSVRVKLPHRTAPRRDTSSIQFMRPARAEKQTNL